MQQWCNFRFLLPTSYAALSWFSTARSQHCFEAEIDLEFYQPDIRNGFRYKISRMRISVKITNCESNRLGLCREAKDGWYDNVETDPNVSLSWSDSIASDKTGGRHSHATRGIMSVRSTSLTSFTSQTQKRSDQSRMHLRTSRKAIYNSVYDLASVDFADCCANSKLFTR